MNEYAIMDPIPSGTLSAAEQRTWLMPHPTAGRPRLRRAAANHRISRRIPVASSSSFSEAAVSSSGHSMAEDPSGRIVVVPETGDSGLEVGVSMPLESVIMLKM